MSDETNKRIGDYQILNELGSGGMGRVYRVRNVISDRIEAMKVLLPDLAGRQELAARFLREIKLMASLNHPNIAALRTAFTADNQLVMVMEYVEGTTLAERLTHGPIPVAEATSYIDQVLSALSYAHQQHVIHRDIKPANMMLTPQGVIKLMDFGIARAGDEHTLTMTGTTLGSLGYMSPEQVKGEPTDARSDLYSVGVSLYELVTGQRPFQAHSDYSIMAAHIKEMPKPPGELQPGLPPALNEIILMAIAKDPAQRFLTADAFRNALTSVRNSLPAPVAPTPSTAPTLDTIAPIAAQQPAPVAAASIPVAAALRAPASAKVAAASNTPSMPIPPPVQSGGHRGLYMTLGALIVLAGLVLAGIYVPRYSRTHVTASAPKAATAASQASESAPQSGTQPAAPAVSDPQAASSASAPPAAPAGIVPAAEITNSTPAKPAQTDSALNSSTSMRAPDAHPQKHVAKNASADQKATAPEQNADAAASAPAAPNAAALDELEHQLDQLSNRSAAVNNSLDRLQQQQSASGYGLRSDMAARQASMKTNLAKAQEAAQGGDFERAKRYMSLAEGDVDALEHFLGH